jgi:hypothetical protein
VCGKDGKPLLSWRVLVLPYLDSQYELLFRKFKLDEPWDSIDNIELLSQMPEFYAPPGYTKDRAPPYHTFIHVFYGNGAPFEWSTGKAFPTDCLNGTASTMLIIEAGKPVPWTKPEDLPYDPNKPLPDLESPFKDGFRASALGGDVSYRWFKKTTDEASLRALIAPNDYAPSRR